MRIVATNTVSWLIKKHVDKQNSKRRLSDYWQNYALLQKDFSSIRLYWRGSHKSVLTEDNNNVHYMALIATTYKTTYGLKLVHV